LNERRERNWGPSRARETKSGYIRGGDSIFLLPPPSQGPFQCCHCIAPALQWSRLCAPITVWPPFGLGPMQRTSLFGPNSPTARQSGRTLASRPPSAGWVWRCLCVGVVTEAACGCYYNHGSGWRRAAQAELCALLRPNAFTGPHWLTSSPLAFFVAGLLAQ